MSADEPKVCDGCGHELGLHANSCRTAPTLPEPRRYRPDEPCAHPGCLAHHTHPCEGCGRIAGRYPALPEPRPDDEGREAELPAHVTPALRSRFRRWANRLRGRYGVPIYLCGSALREDNPDPRDWDIRLMLPDEDFDIRFGPVSEWIEEGHTGNWTRTRFRWSDQCVKDTKDFAAWCLLNGDVQIYPESHATALYGREPRVRIDSFPDDEAALTPHLASLGATDTGRYVPGKWVCPTCGFVQAMLTINAHSGAVSASAERALPCPNDGQYMERQTWEAHARDLEAMLVAALDRERSAPLGATDEGLREAATRALRRLDGLMQLGGISGIAEHNVSLAVDELRAALQAGAAS